MRRFVIICLLLATPVFTGCAHGGGSAADPASSAAAAPASGKPALLINVTRGAGALHEVSMAFDLARSALERGHDVVMFLNVAAPVFATAGLGEDVRYADFPPVTQMVRDVLAKGGTVIVCGHCARVQNIATTDFLPGVVVSQHAELLDRLAAGMVGLSY